MKYSTTQIIGLVEIGTALVLFIAVGITLLVGTMHRNKTELIKCRLINLESFQRGDMDNTTGVMLTFRDLNNKYPPFKFEDETLFGKAWHTLGDDIEVYYDKSNPEKSETKYFWTQYGGSVLVGGIGLITLIVGLVFFLVKGKPMQSISIKE